MTVMLVVPVLPCASRTVAVSVWVPLITERVSHGTVTGPRDDVVCVPTCVPSALSVKTLDDPLVPSTQITTQAVPLTVSLFRGCVMKTLRELGGGGGGITCRRPTARVVSFPRVFPPST